jgi:hypothetical protein
MTSSWIVSAILLLSASAHAYPTIGDKVTWSGTVNNTTGSSEITITKEIIAFDKDSKKWKVKTDTKIGENSTSETVEMAELFTPDRFKDIIKNCEEKGGVIEQITTHPGKYKTCKMTTVSNNGVLIEKWWGDIPFGVVSRNTKDQNGVAQSESPIQSLVTDL